MAPEQDANEQTGLDMAAARAATSIETSEVRAFLYHGQENWAKREKIVNTLSKDPTFDKSRREYLTRVERYNRGQRLTNRVYELAEHNSWSKEEQSLAWASLDEQLAINLHNVAFEPVFLLQASPELLSKYASLVANKGILGCYLQTELGHGTNVQSLETTATYIPETREIDIHSPTLTSTKWWVGALGKMATHGVVQARLILPGGKDVGPHLFFVQLRSLDDHKVLPNIVIGDIGPKTMGGFQATDNGFARFNHVRIPKEQMLSKFARVTDEGEYVQPPHAKLSYGGMLYIRSGMVTSSGWTIAKAVTVAIRYATVRRQGARGPSGLERQIITYPSVYYRLLPILSHAYVFIQLGRSLTNAFATMAARLASGDASLLAELHATTSGLKVACSTMGVTDIETARRSMGGHGYSAYAGLGRLYADALPSCTYEGDNFVLDQQVVRAALKSYQRLLSTAAASSPATALESISPSSYYLRLLIDGSSPPLHSAAHSWRDPAFPIALLEWRAALLVNEHARSVANILRTEQDLDAGLDASANQRVSKAVTEAFMVRRVGEIMAEGVESSVGKQESKAVLRKLYLLYLLTTAESASADILAFNLLPASTFPSPFTTPLGPSATTKHPADPTASLRTEINLLCRELLPNAIGLTDAFGFTDWELDSALGVFDGKVYEALWERAKGEPLNQKEVADAYEESIKHLLLRGKRLAARAAGAKL